MRHVIKIFTPELATDLLQHARDGNIMKRLKIERYKDIMLSGKWKNKVGTPIVFKRGILYDGRHRLTAIVETGLTFEMPYENG